MIYVTIKHDFPQHGSLLKLLDKLYRQLYKYHTFTFKILEENVAIVVLEAVIASNINFYYAH